jgi:CRP-like cAMP-binding protein
MADTARFNRQLAILSPWAHGRVEDRLERRSLPAGVLLYEVQGATDEVYFPRSGVIALLTLTEDGDTVAADLVGAEGVVGAWLSLGVRRSPWRAVALIAGEIEVASAELFVSLLRDEPDFAQRMAALSRALFDATTQSIACRRLHAPSARAAKWLARMVDRLQADTMCLPLAELPSLLGMSETAAQQALRPLIEARMIEEAADGCIRVVDREALDRAACT